MFETYRTNEKGQQEIHLLKQRITSAVTDVLALLPEGRDSAIFKTKIEEAVFFGTRAVASKTGNHTHKTHYTSNGPQTTEVRNVTN